MCAAVVSPPLREPQHYSPVFKVEVCLSQPLWPADNCLHEVLSLSSVLELLCKKESNLAQKEKRTGKNLSVSFKDKAQIIVNQLVALGPKLPTGDVQSYMHAAKVGELYPRAVAFVRNPDTVPCVVSWTAMHDHEEALSAMQKLQGMAKQLNADATCLDNHKYIAHQIAMMHQSLAALSKVSYMADFKQSVETHFSSIKQCINEAADRGISPHLPQEERLWLQELTGQIIQVCHNPPLEIQECMYPAMQVLAGVS